MSKVIEEAKKYSRLHKNNSEMKMFEPLRLISELTAELESKNKEIERLEAVVDKYAGHTDECNNSQTSDGKSPCDCGIDEALSNLKEQDNE